MKEYMENYLRWLNYDKLDSDLKNDLKAIADDTEEIKFRFISLLEFGTAGLRGVMKAGTNAMNIYTVAHATQALSEIIKREGKEARGVVIAYDSRNNSALFARTAASVFASNGIKAYIFDELRPTPLLSFAIRELKCIAGINITASHNPKQYNGYKAYWEDGAQLSPEHAKAVSDVMARCDIFDDVRTSDFDKSVQEGKITVVGKELDEKYIQTVMGQLVNPGCIKAVADDLKIVYTPLNGAGYRLVPEVLNRVGIKHLYTVNEQMTPNGDFPTTPKPNPEYAQVFEQGIKIAHEVCSDLIIATDPDADRVGIMVRNDKNEFVNLSGNQVGALLIDFIISAYEESNTVPKDPYVVKTIVSSELVTKICSDHNIKLYNVLTGFKFIGEVIKKHEEKGQGSFIFGFEESYGYLKGTYARDKDAVVASMLISEMAAFYKAKNMTLYDALCNMYKRYGYYIEGVDEIYMEGLDGIEKMKALMESLRKNPPREIGGEKIAFIRDYKSGFITDLSDGSLKETGLPKSDVLYYESDNGNVTVIRPSGTEPKIKFYFLVHSDQKEKAEKLIKECKQTVKGWVK